MKWLTRIKHAIKRKHFTEKDMDDSDSWYSCAMGEDYQLYQLRQTPKGKSLGLKFMRAVKKNKRREALIIYNEIQKLKKP